jgi:nitroimidazol reductase NimA-like FMN-containing flavoprotein (pyridoxamine 5'-phosphate oxidase superfamily)/RimJ/RimL family protein N-acetyltransferase
MTYPQSARTTASREQARVSYDRALVHAVLDEAYHCHLSFVVDGEPRVLPTLHVRVGDTVYVHGSTGSRPLLAARGGDGLPVCLAVTHIDGLVLARSQFHHSVNYRSVVAHGVARLVTDQAEKLRILTALVNKVAAGRAADTRGPNRRELAETAVLALPLTDVSVKTRTGGVKDEPEDYSLPYWAGVVPLRLASGRPQPDAGVTRTLPDYLRPARSPWLSAAPLDGRQVRLAPLDMSHVDGLFAATADDEVWQHLSSPRPGDREGMAAIVRDVLDAAGRGERVPWVLLSTRTGEVIGWTGYEVVDETNRSLALAMSMLGKPWWGTGVAAESRLLLLTRAFEDLAAVRVQWYADAGDARSQQVLERLGAVREGVLRAHRPRPDGSWVDSVLYAVTAPEWPAVKARLTERLAGR